MCLLVSERELGILMVMKHFSRVSRLSRRQLSAIPPHDLMVPHECTPLEQRRSKLCLQYKGSLSQEYGVTVLLSRLHAV